MHQLIRFLQKNSVFLFFLFLLTLALLLTIQTHQYHKTKFINSANALSGNFFEAINHIQEYIHLKDDNHKLAEENSRLRLILMAADTTSVSGLPAASDSLIGSRYRFIPAKVINNNYALINNYLTLNVGLNQGIQKDMGVISPQGIVGIINQVSDNYATVLSVLNSRSSINARLKKSNHFGSLVWNRKSPNVVQLIDIPRLAPVEVGDTVVTGGKSAIFPDGIEIGIVREITQKEHSNYYEVDIHLFTDMTNLGYVYVIENKNKAEIKSIEALRDE